MTTKDTAALHEEIAVLRKQVADLAVTVATLAARSPGVVYYYTYPPTTYPPAVTPRPNYYPVTYPVITSGDTVGGKVTITGGTLNS